MNTCFQNRCLMFLSYSGPGKPTHLLENMFCMFSEGFLAEQLNIFFRCLGCSGSENLNTGWKTCFLCFLKMAENIDNTFPINVFVIQGPNNLNTCPQNRFPANRFFRFWGSQKKKKKTTNHNKQNNSLMCFFVFDVVFLFFGP